MARTRSFRVGILVECGRDGLEDLLCRRICDLLRDQTGIVFEIDIVPMDNKARLIHECGTVVSGLLADGCDRVVILWDERPAWPQMGDPLCWHNDRTAIIRNLRQAGVDVHIAHLVCIEREFEILAAPRRSYALRDLVDRGSSCPGSRSKESPPDAESERNHDQPVP